MKRLLILLILFSTCAAYSASKYTYERIRGRYMRCEVVPEKEYREAIKSRTPNLEDQIQALEKSLTSKKAALEAQKTKEKK